MLNSFMYYSKTRVKRPFSKRPKIGFQDQLLLHAGQKYCRMLQGGILQYFRPSLSYHLSLKSFFSIFEWPFYKGFTVHSFLMLSNYFAGLHYNWYVFTSRVKNSVDPDQLAS